MASSDNHLVFFHFFFLGMILITASYTMSQTSIHSSSGTLSDLIPWICHLHYIIIGGLIWVIPEWSNGFPYFLQFKSEFCNKEFIIWSSRGRAYIYVCIHFPWVGMELVGRSQIGDWKAGPSGLPPTSQLTLGRLCPTSGLQQPSLKWVFFPLLLNWSIITLQCYVSFCCIMKWINYMYTYIPSLLSFLPTRPPIPLL